MRGPPITDHIPPDAPGGSPDHANPLREYRMSMLGHGFVDEGHGDGFDLDESDPVAYGIIPIGRVRPLAIIGTVGFVVVIVLVIVLFA